MVGSRGAHTGTRLKLKVVLLPPPPPAGTLHLSKGSALQIGHDAAPLPRSPDCFGDVVGGRRTGTRLKLIVGHKP